MIEIHFVPHVQDLALVDTVVGSGRCAGSTKPQTIAPGSTTAQQHRRRRTVRFATDRKGRILEQVCPIASLPAHFDADLYWSSDDHASFRQRAHRLSKAYRAALPHRVFGLESTYYALSNEGHSPEEMREHFDISHKWSTTNGRGLERGVTSLFRREQRRALRETVEYYQALLQKGVSNIDEELERFSSSQSYRACNFALLMAYSDSLIAMQG